MNQIQTMRVFVCVAEQQSFVEHALDHFSAQPARERTDYGFLRPPRGPDRSDIVTGLQ
ncbi:hypothetical protein [Burkholderia cepacia]|uniref:hypothetical protein n=1 Tax=Burkholderia cepacia TaxID=292 RepID=UPI001CF37DA7|nr:hypothetical protein [Burkholderia cepacia]MCA8398391.1 hypothetical protein [Burkholderia cepacia]